MHLLEQYGTDAVRYWAASGRPGVDTAFDEGQMKIGRKLALKLLNVSKFVLGFGEPATDAIVSASIDQAMLGRLAGVIDDATSAFEAFDYARALERTEGFFWWFCDDYVELVKARAYGTQDEAGAQSARAALRLALSAVTRAFAPFLPFVTDEVWRWWQPGSVHAAAWPTADELGAGISASESAAAIEPVSEVLAQVRRAKTEAKVSQRAAIDTLVVHAPDAARTAVEAALADLRDAGSIASVTFAVGEQIVCEVTLAPVADTPAS